MSKQDITNHPPRYNQYSVEVIDMIERIWGIENTIKWCEITAFSDEWASVAEVEDYLIRQGYMYMWP